MRYSNKGGQLDSLVSLRGIACMLVCLCHFTFALNKGDIFDGFFEIFHKYGKFGVHIFFVISGFVIPLSLEKGGYILKNYFTFLYKRFLRLHPPYLAALVITYVLNYFALRITHETNNESIFNFIKSIFFLHFPAANPVFWTLAIEAQYYFFIGVFFIALTRFNKASCIMIVPLLLFLSQTIVADKIQLLHFLVFFLIGNMGFFLYFVKHNRILNSGN